MQDYLVSEECENKNIFTVPTTNGEGNYSVLISYCSKYFKEDIPAITEEIIFGESIKGKKVTVYCIDKTHTNPYRAWERACKPEMTDELLRELRGEGKMKPFASFTAKSDSISLDFTPNATYLVLIG